jgi:PAS domain S-box-containing protein
MIRTFVNVTERRLLEEALQMAKFSLDHAPDEVLWITSDGQLYYVNDAACDKLGYTHDRLLSMSIWEVDTGFTRDDWPERWRELKELKYLNFESGHVTRNGAVFPANVAMHYIEFKGKEYPISFVRDIGEIKRVQDNLARAEVDLSRAQRIARIGTWTWNLENDQAQWSDEVYRILEISRTEGALSSREFLHFVDPEDRGMVEHAINEATARSGNFSIDHRLRLRNGDLRYVHTEGETATDATGKAIRLQGAIQDITVLRLVEIARDSLRKQLEFEHARLETVLRNMPAGIVIAEAPSGRIIMANQRMGDIFRIGFLYHRASINMVSGVFQPSGHRYDWKRALARSVHKGEEIQGEEMSFCGRRDLGPDIDQLSTRLRQGRPHCRRHRHVL